MYVHVLLRESLRVSKKQLKNVFIYTLMLLIPTSTQGAWDDYLISMGMCCQQQADERTVETKTSTETAWHSSGNIFMLCNFCGISSNIIEWGSGVCWLGVQFGLTLKKMHQPVQFSAHF